MFILRGASASVARAQLLKSQSVRDRLGGAHAFKGSIITYTIKAMFDPEMAARNIHIADTIPEGTAYVPGSLTLDGLPLTDTADRDAGKASAAGVDVVVPTGGDGAHTVTFQVTILLANPILGP